MNLKGFAVAAALLILGVFLFMNFLERQSSKDFARRKTAVEQAQPQGTPQQRTGSAPAAAPTAQASPELIGVIDALEENFRKQCHSEMAADPSKLPKEWLTEGMMDSQRSLTRSFVCEALASRDPAACRPLARLSPPAKEAAAPGAEVPEAACRRDFHDFRSIALGVQGDVQAEKECVASFEDHSWYKERNLDDVCAVLVGKFRLGGKNPDAPLSQHVKDSRDSCSQTGQYLKRGVPEGRFLGLCNAIALGLVDPSNCNRIPQPAVRVTCLDKSAVYWASVKKDPRFCGDSAICRAAVTGNADSCGELRSHAFDRYCREWSRKQVQATFNQEMRFRWDNRLPGYEPGDPFVHRMPEEERSRYVKEYGRPQPPRSPESQPAPDG